MAVAFRSVGVSPGANATSCVIIKPVGLAVDDLMIAQVVFRADDNLVAPGDWTKIRQDVRTDGIFSSALFYKIAVQADVDAVNFTFPISGSNKENRGAITVWYGHSAENPIDADNGQTNVASTTVTAPEVTPSIAECMILMICGINDNNTQIGYAIATDNPPSWDERYDLPYDGAYGDCGLSLASALRTETTATGNGTATTSASDKNIGQLIAIAPPAAPAGLENKSAGMAAKMIAGKLI